MSNVVFNKNIFENYSYFAKIINRTCECIFDIYIN